MKTDELDTEVHALRVCDDVHALLASVLADPDEIKKKIENAKNDLANKKNEIKSLELLYKAATTKRKPYKKRAKKAAEPVAAE